MAGRDAYQDLWTEAAALLDSIVNDHALVDGNERLGWLATATFLELNDAPATTIPDDEVHDLVMAVADRHLDLDELAARLEESCSVR